MNYEEDKVQMAISQYLKLKGILHTFTGGGCIHSYKTQIIANRLGYEKGTSDLICFLPEGKTLCIEVKRPETYSMTKTGVKKNPAGKQSKEQKAFEQKIIALGHNYIVATSIDDVVKALKNLGFEK